MRFLAGCFLLSVVSPLLAGEAKVQRDVPYADTKHERQTLDVYAPAGGTNHPIVVWIHGGGWVNGDKKEMDKKPQAFVDQGFVFVSVNYRLLRDNVTIKQMAEDVAKAIRWTHDHAKEHGGDAKTFFIMGHSAGAQLSAILCTDDSYLKAEKLSLAMIKGCVPVDGDTYDVPLAVKNVEKKRAEFRRKFGDEQSQKDLSSVTHVARRKNIPAFLILYVAADPLTKPQSERLAEVLQAGEVPVQVYAAEGKTHKTINSELGEPDDKTTQTLFKFLDRLLKK